jgi:hypothetical protein
METVASQTLYQFGNTGNLKPELQESYEIPNAEGYSYLGFYLTIPVGATVQFQSSFDGVNYEPYLLRGPAGTVSQSTISGTFQGYVAGYRMIRLLVSVAGSTAGSVLGTMSFQANASTNENSPIPVEIVDTIGDGGEPANGTDGTDIVPPTGGVGIRGWLSGIYQKLSNALSVTFTNTAIEVSNFPDEQAVTGPLTDAELRADPLPVVALVTATSLPLPDNAATQTTLVSVVMALNDLLSELQDKADLSQTQPVSATALPLPAGAATQATLALVVTALGTLLTELQNKADLSETQPVSGTFYQATQPVSAAALPLPSGAATQATLASLLTELQAKADLAETQPVSATSLPLPTGAATQTTLALVVTALSALLTELQNKADLNETQPVSGTFFQATQPVSAAALPLPSGAATQATQASLLTELLLKAKLTDTQPVSAAALPLPTGAATQATLASIQTVLGTLLTELQNKADLSETQPVSGTFFQATQPVSAAALPLPSGAATQTTLAALLTELQGKADLAETQPISATALPLPTGAATQTTLAALLTELLLKAKLTDTQPVSGPLTDTQLRATPPAVNSYLTSPSQAAIGMYASISPFGNLNIEGSLTAQLYDPFDTVLDTTDRWNATGTVPPTVVTSGCVASLGAVNAASSILTSKPTFTPLGQHNLLAATLDIAAQQTNPNAHRFFGMGVVTSYAAATPVTDGFGLEIDLTGALNCVAYVSGVRYVANSTDPALITAPGSWATNMVMSTYGQTMTWPTTGEVTMLMRYVNGIVFIYLSGGVTFGVVPVAVMNYRSINSILPIRFATITTPAVSTVLATTFKVSALLLAVSGGNNFTLSDQTFPFRQAKIDANGNLAVIAGPPVNPMQFASGAITNTTAVQAFAAGAAGIRNYITSFTAFNTSATGTIVEIRDGATVIYRGYLNTFGQPVCITFPTPLRGSAATAINVAMATNATNSYVSLTGFQAA